MGIAAEAPRGGLSVAFDGATRPLVLRNAEIERFEDRHRGIFAVRDGFFGRGLQPTAREVRDLVALGLVGGGMGDHAADALVADLGPGENLRLYQVAQALVGVAFYPDAEAADTHPPREDAGGEDKKKAPGA